MFVAGARTAGGPHYWGVRSACWPGRTRCGWPGAIEQAVEAELKSFIPGTRGIRIDALAEALAGFGLALLFGYAFTWAGVCLTMVLRSVEVAQQLGFIIFLPLTFISNAFVPTQGMPAWLRAVADWNPFSAVAAACRQLFGNPNLSALVQAWPMQHRELAVLLWSAVLLVVFAPLAVHLYRRKSLT